MTLLLIIAKILQGFFSFTFTDMEKEDQIGNSLLMSYAGKWWVGSVFNPYAG